MKQVYLDDLTFERFNNWLMFEQKHADKQSAITPRRYRFNEIKTFFREKPFTRENFADYIAEKKIAGFKNSTINRKISCGKQIALYFGLKTFSDMTYFPENKRGRKDVLTWDEMDRVSTAYVEYKKGKYGTPESLNYKYYCLIRLLSETGCRIGEAVGLTWYGLDGNVVTFYDTKNSEDRIVVITPQLSQELRELPHVNDRVFGQTTVSWATYEIKRRAAIAGVVKKQSVSPHLFRHSVITNLAIAGAPINLVQELAGHKSLNTTAMYIHNTIADMETMLYSYSGLWETRLDAKSFMERAKLAVAKVLTKQSHRIKLDEDTKFYLIKVPKNAFL